MNCMSSSVRGRLGLAVMSELHKQGKHIRLVNRERQSSSPRGCRSRERQCCPLRQHTPGMPGCDCCLQLCQRALYGLGCAFSSHAGCHYPGRSGGQCQACRGRKSVCVTMGDRAKKKLCHRSTIVLLYNVSAGAQNFQVPASKDCQRIERRSRSLSIRSSAAMNRNS